MFKKVRKVEGRSKRGHDTKNAALVSFAAMAMTAMPLAGAQTPGVNEGKEPTLHVVRAKALSDEIEQRIEARNPVVVIGREDIEKTNDLTLGDFLRRQPGISFTGPAGKDLCVGARADVLRPAGSFVLPARLHGEVVLVAAGIGITPLRAMVLAWAARQNPAPLTLIWSVRHRVELMNYDAEFQALARQMPHFRYQPVLTGHDPSWDRQRGRIDAARVRGFCFIEISINQDNQ